MSIKCNQCKNKIFDSRAYLKMSQIEKEIEEQIDKCKDIKDKDIRLLRKQVLIDELKLVNRCKNTLY